MGLEIELKAKITPQQVEYLLKNSSFYNDQYLRKEQPIEFLIKKDLYYSFNGDTITSPRNKIRIRKETVLKYQDMSDLDLIGFFDFKKEFDSDDGDSNWYFTVKQKSMDVRGVEANQEFENRIINEPESIQQFLQFVNFKTYFTKEKRSISFYVGRKRVEFHVEIVSVNGIGPYLEVEVTMNTEDVAIIKTELVLFFERLLGIKEFDNRQWETILKEDEDDRNKN